VVDASANSSLNSLNLRSASANPGEWNVSLFSSYVRWNISSFRRRDMVSWAHVPGVVDKRGGGRFIDAATKLGMGLSVLGQRRLDGIFVVVVVVEEDDDDDDDDDDFIVVVAVAVLLVSKIMVVVVERMRILLFWGTNASAAGRWNNDGNDDDDDDDAVK
jgi:hypothetical protein